ncbi:tetratricopeptide repeat protein [Phyllobacterium sp. 628]|uniref:hypothetical protein n=1 Tax=Phyllobacterium sp. 628 TaxID=2718938 RepID=UPI0016622A96|nr:hypothetical protein [Phyllobacterium sp. 628]QND53193.1 tetratricopeptide repeat protein [Phyllobacterium sp. 628]
MKKFVSIVCGVVIGFVVLVGGRYYQYVTNTSTPYDEVGISLNSYMPAPIKKWGCDQLKKNFANNPPPYGCAAEIGRDWM